MTDIKHEYSVRVSLSFPIHVLVNSLLTVDIMSLDTITFSQWKLSRPLNNIGRGEFEAIVCNGGCVGRTWFRWFHSYCRLKSK